MRIILNGRKVGNGDDACYFENKAYFTKRGLKKRTVLHELYHHIIYSKGIEEPNRVEKKGKWVCVGDTAKLTFLISWFLEFAGLD
jgi:hypothetical protein